MTTAPAPDDGVAADVGQHHGALAESRRPAPMVTRGHTRAVGGLGCRRASDAMLGRTVGHGHKGGSAVVFQRHIAQRAYGPTYTARRFRRSDGRAVCRTPGTHPVHSDQREPIEGPPQIDARHSGTSAHACDHPANARSAPTTRAWSQYSHPHRRHDCQGQGVGRGFEKVFICDITALSI